MSQKINKEELLERHNYYRDKVNVPHLKWSEELAIYSQKWADNLAKKCNLIHSKSSYGENIYWTNSTAIASEVVDNWAAEEKYFSHRTKLYKGSKGSKYGHYTQIIWRGTTHVGGAMQKCKHGGEIWVCNYSPAGNWLGEKVY